MEYSLCSRSLISAHTSNMPLKVRTTAPIKRSSLIINSFCATGKAIHVFHGSALTLPAFVFGKETSFNVLSKDPPSPAVFAY